MKGGEKEGRQDGQKERIRESLMRQQQNKSFLLPNFRISTYSTDRTNCAYTKSAYIRSLFLMKNIVLPKSKLRKRMCIMVHYKALSTKSHAYFYKCVKCNVMSLQFDTA